MESETGKQLRLKQVNSVNWVFVAHGLQLVLILAVGWSLL